MLNRSPRYRSVGRASLRSASGHRWWRAARRGLSLLATLSVLVAEPKAAVAAEAEEVQNNGTPLYFLNDVDYGSDSEFNPVQTSIHLSYDILRNASYQDNPFKMAYGAGFENVAKNLIHPFDAIEKSG